jgi:agmatine deiminase
VLCRERNPKDANYRALAENRERLQDARLASGARPQVVECRCRRRSCSMGDGCRRGYANFYVANAAVLVPTFNDPNDRVALAC